MGRRPHPVNPDGQAGDADEWFGWIDSLSMGGPVARYPRCATAQCAVPRARDLVWPVRVTCKAQPELAGTP
jgi:hypothetical protein